MRILIIYLSILIPCLSHSQVTARGGKDLLIELCVFPNLGIDSECEVYDNDYVDFPASFPEGKSSLQTHVINRCKEYSREILKKYNGKFLYVNVIVEKDGLISNIMLFDNDDNNLDTMLMNIFNTLPLWNPAIHNNLTVCSSYTFSLKIYDEK